MKQPKLILGIDGGGTKTEMVLTDENETILARVQAGASNMHTVDAKTSAQNLKAGLSKLFKEAKIKPRKLAALAGGFAGIDGPEDLARAEEVVSKACKNYLPPQKKIRLVNDTIIGFWSGTQKKEGLCLIGGTGSNCYGRTKSGREAWAGGLDWILSDEGSGFEQGWLALRAAVKSADGRGPKSKLEQMVLKHYGVKTIRQLLPIIYAEGYGKHDIGQLALLVEDAAVLCKDKAAKEICQHSVHELVLLAQAVVKQLGFAKTKEFDLVIIGGVIQRNPLVHQLFKQSIKRIFPRVSVIVPKEKPSVGAARLAISTLK